MIIEESGLVHNTKNSKNSKTTKFTDGSHNREKYYSELYEEIKLLAEGGFSKVFLLKEKSTGNLKVLKINKFLEKDNPEYLEYGLPNDIIREIAVMQELDDEFIVKKEKVFYLPG